MIFLQVLNKFHEGLCEMFPKSTDFENLSNANFDIEVKVEYNVYSADFHIVDRCVRVDVNKYVKNKDRWVKSDIDKYLKHFLEVSLEASFPCLWDEIYNNEIEEMIENKRIDKDEFAWRETMRSLQFFR